MANSILDMAKELRELGETNRSMVFKLNIGKIYGIDLILEAKGATELDAYNLRLAEKFLKSKMEILQMKNPNEIKSQDDVTVNQGGRSSDVLLATIEKCEKLELKLNIAVNALKNTLVLAKNGKSFSDLLKSPENFVLNNIGRVLANIENDCALALQEVNKLDEKSI